MSSVIVTYVFYLAVCIHILKQTSDWVSTWINQVLAVNQGCSCVFSLVLNWLCRGICNFVFVFFSSNSVLEEACHIMQTVKVGCRPYPCFYVRKAKLKHFRQDNNCPWWILYQHQQIRWLVTNPASTKSSCLLMEINSRTIYKVTLENKWLKLFLICLTFRLKINI